jgi:hypothetical protein
MKFDLISGVLFAGMLLSGTAANVIFLRMWSRLEAVGQQPSSLLKKWPIIKTLKLYRRLAPQNCWPAWFPAAFWICFFFASAFLLVLVHPWKDH